MTVDKVSIELANKCDENVPHKLKNFHMKFKADSNRFKIWSTYLNKFRDNSER